MFAARASDRIQLVADDRVVTDASRVRDDAANGLANAALIKPNQAGTLTAARAALDEAKAHGWTTIVSARSGETEDVAVAHLAMGWRASGIKIGSIARGERTAKWNELLRIEEALGPAALFGGWSALSGGNHPV